MQVRFGPYSVVEKLGQGAMGVVYRAHHLESAEIVAIKTIDAAGTPYLTGIRREIHALSRLRHPGLMRILDHGIEAGIPWYAMPLIEADSLRQRLQRGSMPEREWMPLVQKLCHALAFLHGEGMVHRDLKPENILIGQGNSPILSDFGLVSLSGSESSRESLDWGETSAGTAAYIAPEQIQGQVVDARADMYALGCIVYEILTGSPPFIGSSVRDILKAHREATPVAPSTVNPDVDPRIEELVLRLLSKSVSDRVAYAGDVAILLGRIAGNGAPAGSTPARAHLYRPSLYGRMQELEVVRKLLLGLEDGTGGILWIAGESGVGKTRFLQEVVSEAAISRFTILRGDCSTDTSAPLQLFRKPLQALIEQEVQGDSGSPGGRSLPEAAVLRPYQPLFEAYPENTAPLPLHELPPEAARIRIYRALAGMLEMASSDWPVLLVLDDVHRADELSSGFLKFLLRSGRLEKLEMLVLCAYRSEETPEWLSPTLTKKRGLLLKRLERPAIISMVADMLAQKASPDLPCVPVLERQSRGNPFFISEYLRAAASQNLLRRNTEGRWEFADSALIPALPESIQGLIQRRLSMLSYDARTLVAAAAVLGRHGDYETLQKVSRFEDSRWLEGLDELFRRHVLEEEAGTSARFVHDKIREVVYGQIDSGLRAELHRRAANALEASQAIERRECVADLAEHYQGCGEMEQARECYFEASRIAAQHYAYSDAEKLLRAALALPLQAPHRKIAWMELADLLRLSGRLEEATQACGEALTICRETADRVGEGRTLSLLAAVYWPQGKLQEADRIAGEALSIHNEQSDREGGAKTLTTLAAIRWSRGLLDDARMLYEDALLAHRELGDRRQEGSDLSNLGVMDLDQGRLEEAALKFEEALKVQRETGDRRFEGVSLSNLANIRLYQNRKKEARALFEQALAIQRQVSDRRSEGATLNNLAWMLMEEKQYNETRLLYEEALAAQRDVGDRLFEAHTVRNLAQLERESQGDLKHCAELLQNAQELFEELQNWPGVALCLCERGHLALALGRSTAPRYLKKAGEIAQNAGMGPSSELGLTINRLKQAITGRRRKLRNKR